MESIALYYPSLEHSGGIERVVVELCRIFEEKKYSCVLYTDIEPHFYRNRINVECILLPSDIVKRQNTWIKTIQEHNVQFVITNGGFGVPDLEDIKFIHDAGAKVINTIHFSFPSPMLFNEAWESYANVLKIGKECDAVATVNKLDAIWWRALGCNAFPVRNPFTYYDHSNTTKDYASHTLIWVGRGAPQKKPVEALEIVAEIAKQVPDVKLLMVGVEKGAFYKDIKKLDIEKNIEIIPPTNEIGKYYERASIHLLTSVTESFCLVVAEAKSYRIPTVMYDVPFIELVEDCKGVIIHEQSDIKGMAKSIIELFHNPERIKQMGEDAYETLSDFNDDEVVSRWQMIFDNLQRGECCQTDVISASDIIVREIYSAWMNHCQQNVWKIEFFDNIERATGHSVKAMIDTLTKAIINPLKNIKRKIR